MQSLTTIQKTELIAGLYIVAVPIGHWDDITLRALQVLESVEYIACEDTRMTGKLLTHHGIDTPMLRYDDHSSQRQREAIQKKIEQGASVALVSDAGTPLISDPGYKLVKMLQASGLYVASLPGASSVITALTLCGLPTDRFFFEGFLPSKQGAKEARLTVLSTIKATHVIFESANRLLATLHSVERIFGQMVQCSVLRELTKTYEEIQQGTPLELVQHYSDNILKGEIILVLDGASQREYHEEDIMQLIREKLQDTSVKDTVNEVASLVSLPKKTIYAYALSIKDATGEES